MRVTFLLFCFFIAIRVVNGGDELSIAMPPMEVHYNDAYLCTSVQLPTKSLKLTSVEPRADQKVVHHMLLFGSSVFFLLDRLTVCQLGCQTPSNESEVWSCMGSPCKDAEVVLYGWGRNAASIQYPSGVAFSIGSGTDITSLVLQIHYVSGRSLDDASGIVLKLSEEASEKTASVLMYASFFSIPPRQNRYPVRNKCCYSGFEPIHTVAFRVHTHELGRTVYMKKFTGGAKEADGVLAERNPLLPQGFVSVNASNTVHPGEQLEVTCEYNSTEKNHTVQTGATHKDEMCNMYMIVYSEIPHFGQCVNDRGFYSGQKTGVMNKEGQFKEEVHITNLWRDPVLDKIIGQAVSITRGHDGKLWFLHRADHEMNMIKKDNQLHSRNRSLIASDTVLLLDPKTGKVLSSWGSNIFNIPHMLTIDIDGSIWITDVGLHQVFKFSSDGVLLMTLGEAFIPGSDTAHFCAPAQAITLTDGSILVADGYCNRRIIKFSPNGEFINEVTADAAGLLLPHSLLADECNDLLFVGDRQANDVFIFQLSDLSAPARSMALNGGQIMALTRGPYSTILALAWQPNQETTIFQFDSTKGQVKVIAKWRIPSFAFPHDITLSAAPIEATGAGDRLFALYVTEVDSHRLRKFILCPPNFEFSTSNDQDHEVQKGHYKTKVTSIHEESEKDHTTPQNAANVVLQQAEEVSGIHSVQLISIILPIVAIGFALIYFRRRRRKKHSSNIDRFTR
eukprot:g5457.t1